MLIQLSKDDRDALIRALETVSASDQDWSRLQRIHTLLLKDQQKNKLADILPVQTRVIHTHSL